MFTKIPSASWSAAVGLEHVGSAGAVVAAGCPDQPDCPGMGTALTCRASTKRLEIIERDSILYEVGKKTQA